VPVLVGSDNLFVSHCVPCSNTAGRGLIARAEPRAIGPHLEDPT
jgi:hypothetical protein